MKPDLLLLATGILFLLTALLLRATGATAAADPTSTTLGITPTTATVYFYIFLTLGIALKTLFLISVFRRKGFRPSPGLYLILSGVALILFSLIFKTIYPAPRLRSILIIIAIALKSTGIIFLIITKLKNQKEAKNSNENTEKSV
jgi:predicted membrane channel-forming protein YqfA (hemolysin III family)